QSHKRHALVTRLRGAERLLPESSPAVQAIERFKQDYSLDLNPAALLVEGPNPETNRAAVDALEKILRDRADVEFVQVKRPTEFFEQRRLLYADLSALETLTERVRNRVDWAKKQANPLYVSVDDSEPPKIEADDLFDKRGEVLPEHAYFRNDQGNRYVVFADLGFTPLTFQKTETFRGEVTEAFEAWAAEHNADVDLAFSGRHFKQRQQRQAHRRHISRATLLAGVAVLFFLMVYFRRWLAPLIVFGPLACGTIWAFGWAEASVGRLTPLAASFGAVLVGLGIDYGIHLFVRYTEERRTGSHWQSVVGMFRKAGPPCFFACATTALAFGALTTSSVPGFAEFGIIALGGIICILLAYTAILPLIVGSDDDETSATEGRTEAGPVREWVGRVSTAPWTRATAALGLVVLIGVGAFGIDDVTFNDSFKAVFVNDVDALQTEETIRKTVGVRQQPAFVPVENLEHAERVVEALEKRRESRSNGHLIDQIVSLSRFIPGDQDEKIAVLEQLRETLADVPDRAVDNDEKLQEIRRELDFVLAHAPLGRQDLPERIRRRFSKTSGNVEASIVAVYPSRPIYRASTAAGYVDLLSGLPDGQGGQSLAPVAYERMLSDLVGYVAQDTRRILGLLIAGLLVLAFVAAPDLWEWIGSVSTLAVGLFVSAGVCGLLDIEFNFLNVVVWPIWIGVDLDALFHLNRHPPPTDREAQRQLSDF
ncbi:MAG: MMPL family transporter, partial [Bradymonadaceae bacterium]